MTSGAVGQGAPALDILIPTYRRPAALAVTLATLVGQSFTDYRVVIADQTEDGTSLDRPEVQACIRVLRSHGHEVALHRREERRGMAEQRAYLLDQSTAPACLFLDDDLVLEPWAVQEMHQVLMEEGCGFVGSAVIGLSYAEDERPHEQHIELWDGPVEPESIRPNTTAFERYRLHNAANLLHVQSRLPFTPRDPGRYRVAWVGGCVMYARERLRACGGFDFWRDLPPEHAGEDVLAQWRVMERYGGCAVIPSGVYHQELPTTIPDREVDAPQVLGIDR